MAAAEQQGLPGLSKQRPAPAAVCEKKCVRGGDHGVWAPVVGEVSVSSYFEDINAGAEVRGQRRLQAPRPHPTESPGECCETGSQRGDVD